VLGQRLILSRFITTPLLLLDLLLTAGTPWPRILWVIIMDWIMIVTGLVGALTPSRYKWGFYAFGCAAMFYIFFTLLGPARRSASFLGSDISRCYNSAGLWTLVLWLAYPIAWGVADGGNVIAPDSEMIFYGVLDVLTKIGFSAILLTQHDRIDPARMGCKIRTQVPLDEAKATPAANNGMNNGMNNGVTA
jgi:bacteriorhodopsin